MEEEEFKDKLTVRQYAVLRQKETEKPFTGEFVDFKGQGVFTCAACGAPVFSADSKFDAKTGWASFSKPLNEDAVEIKGEEVLCKKCGSYLGKRYHDGPAEFGGERYSLNSLALALDSEEDEDDDDDDDDKKKGRSNTAKNAAILAAVAIASVAFGATGYGALVCRPASGLSTLPVRVSLEGATSSDSAVVSNTASGSGSASTSTQAATGGAATSTKKGPVSTGSAATSSSVVSVGSTGGGQPQKDAYAFNDIVWIFKSQPSGDPTTPDKTAIGIRLIELTKNDQPVTAGPVSIASYEGTCAEIDTPIQDKGEISSAECTISSGDGKQLGIFREGDLLKVRVRDVIAGSSAVQPLSDLMTIDLAALAK